MLDQLKLPVSDGIYELIHLDFPSLIVRVLDSFVYPIDLHSEENNLVDQPIFTDSSKVVAMIRLSQYDAIVRLESMKKERTVRHIQSAMLLKETIDAAREKGVIAHAQNVAVQEEKKPERPKMAAVPARSEPEDVPLPIPAESAEEYVNFKPQVVPPQPMVAAVPNNNDEKDGKIIKLQ